MNFIEAIAAQNKDVPAVMPLDFFSYLLGKSQASPTKTITGVPPFTFKSNGDSLVDWSIKGNTGGVGERTKNLFKITENGDTVNGITYSTDAETGTATFSGTCTSTNSICPIGYVTFSEDTYVYLSGGADGGANDLWYLYAYDMTSNTRPKKWDGTSTSVSVYDSQVSQEILCPAGHIIRIAVLVRGDVTVNNIVFKPMLRAADTSADFIPYGYEIPVTCGGTTTNIFIGDSPLGADDTITKTSTGVDIPTVNGSNTLTVDTTVQPSEMSITYHR